MKNRDLRKSLAGAHMNRGLAKQYSAAHGPEAAIADYDPAIDLMEALGADLGTTRTQSPELRNSLAMAYVNRGNVEQDSAARGAYVAIADYDAAIALMEAMRADLGAAWGAKP